MRRALAATLCGTGLLMIAVPARAGCEVALPATRDGGVQVLTLEEAAAFLRLDGAALAAAAARGEIPGRHVLGVWRFSRAALIAWLAGAEPVAGCFDGRAAAAAHVPAPKPGGGQDLPAEAEVPPRDLARITGAGSGAARGPELAQAPEPAPPPAAEAPAEEAAGEEPERFGEEPELETARELALREEAVLGRRGALQLETELSFARQEALVPVQTGPAISLAELEQETLALGLTARYALSERFQLQAGGALSHRSGSVNAGFVELDDRPSEDTFGDVRLGMRYQVLREDTARPAVFLSGDGTLPTDGSDTYSLGGSVALTKRFDPTTVFGSLGYLHAFNADERGLVPDDRIATTLGFIFVMNDRLAFRTAVEGTFFPESEARGVELRSDERFDLSFSLPSVLSENVSLEPSVSFGLDEGPGSRFGVGISLISSFSAPALF